MKIELVEKPVVKAEFWRSYQVFVDYWKAQRLMRNFVELLELLQAQDAILGYNFTYYYEQGGEGHLSIRLGWKAAASDVSRKTWLVVLEKEAQKIKASKITETEYTESDMVRMGYELGSKAAALFLINQARGRARKEWLWNKEFQMHLFHGLANALGFSSYSSEAVAYLGIVEHFLTRFEYEAGQAKVKKR